MLYAANLSILPVMPSGPQAFVTSILLNRLVTSSTEEKGSSDVQDVRDCAEQFDCCSSGGARVLKQEVKKLLRRLAFSEQSLYHPLVMMILLICTL